MKTLIRKQRGTHRLFEDLPEHGEANHEPSMTIQGETTSIEEIIRRYSQGLELPKRPTEYLDSDFDNPEGWTTPDVDLVDLQQHNKRMEDYKRQIDAFEAEEKAKKQEEPK